MNRRRSWAMLLGVGAALAGAGCATTEIRHAYDGPHKPPSELATVWGSTNRSVRILGSGPDRISIAQVDGESTVPWYSLASYPSAVHVLPGRRKLDIQYEFIHGVANGPVWVDAQTNRTYQVKVMNPDQRTQRVYFLIEDVTAQTLVGGTEKQAE